MAQTFNVAEVSYSPSETREPRVTSVKFDDQGYELRMRRGLNGDLQQWEVPINVISVANANVVEGFLTAHGGVDWFWWIPPRQTVAKKFICKRWSREPVNGSKHYDKMSLSFQEVVDIVG
jgi:phage-related protein